MTGLRLLLLAGCALSLTAGPAAAQNRRCRLELLNSDRQLVRSQVTPATSNYFTGGNVRMKCAGQEVRVWTDSVASYTDQVIQFIGNFRFEDEATKVTSDFGTYYRDDERWEATGNVVYINRKDGSKLEGPNATYRRRIGGTREVQEVFADQRPTLTLASTDSAVRTQEPYIVVADRVRMRGEDQMWAGGTVTIDRSDLRGRGDSLQFDTGKGNKGALIGTASIRRAVRDSFALTAKRIDLGLTKKELNRITGRDTANLLSKELRLTAATIEIVMEDRRVVQTHAWGKSPRPRALADDYEVRGDSLAIDTPQETLKELRAYQRAWVGFRPDSLRGERDYLTGDSVTAFFVQQGSMGKSPKATLSKLESRANATSFYRVASRGGAGCKPSLNYNRADRILLTMQLGIDSVKVQLVEMTGEVDGMQLQPEVAAKRDSTARADSAAKPDTARARPVGC